MIHAKQSRNAFGTLQTARRFSRSHAPAAVSPYRQPVQPSTSTSKSTVDPAVKRDQSTAAATVSSLPERPIPSPAFNREGVKWNDIQQPFKTYRPQQMDHTFVGKKGGEIFHEMMLRQGVRHVC